MTYDPEDEHFGRRLYVTNIRPETTEDELRQFLGKYAQHEPEAIHRVDLDTGHPAYTIRFPVLPDGDIQTIANRINGMYWHGKLISVHVI